ncbi:MAG: hypothetical protein WA913_06160, partial [Pricia sp.]
FSYDEPLQYCFIFLALIALIRKRWFSFVPFFTLALISRETSMLLLPALVCFAPGLNLRFKLFSKAHLKLCVPVLLPLLLYGVYMVIFISSRDQLEATRIEMGSRFSCFLENFESTENTLESMISLFLALGPFVYLTFFGRKQNTNVSLNNTTVTGSEIDRNAGSHPKTVTGLKGSMITVSQKRWASAFLLTAIINTPLVILTAFARETRLFALPLFFVWPVFMQVFEREIQLLFDAKKYGRRRHRPPKLILFLLAMAANYWFCFQFYPALGLGENTFFGEYLFMANLFILMHVLVRSPNDSE